MENESGYEFELYPFESFRTLLTLEINRTRRYKTPLSLIHLVIEIEPDSPEIRRQAEMFAINTLDIQLRDTDIPCIKGGEFLVLMPATDASGGRIVCNRLAELFNTARQKYDRVSFQMTAFIGMTSLAAGASLSDTTLMQQAFTAMQHARDRRLITAVSFSQIK